MGFDINDKTNKPIITYLGKKNFVVIDKSPLVRSTVSKMLTSMGVKGIYIFQFDTYNEAKTKISDSKVNFVFCPSQLGRQHARELLDFHMKVVPNRLDSGLWILADHQSPNLMAEMAEMEIEGFICKPFTLDALREMFLKGMTRKVNPSNYDKNLEVAKIYYQKKEFDKALETIAKAKEASKKPPILALYYEGMIYKDQENISKAIECFQEGLKIIPTYYKCLNELLNIYNQQKRHQDAYEIGELLADNYSLGPNKLINQIKLAMACGKHENIHKYYEIFSNLEDPDDNLKMNVAVGLSICGKFLIQKDKEDKKAIDILLRASEICKRKVTVMVNVVSALTEAGQTAKAEKILEKMVEDDPDSNEVKVLDLDIRNQAMSSAEALKRATELYNANIKAPKVFEILIRRSIEIKRKKEVIDNYIDEACRLFGDQKKFFQELRK